MINLKQKCKRLFSYLGQHSLTCTACLSVTFCCGLLAPSLHAQGVYADYPQTRGKVQNLKWDSLPSWITLDMDLRGRTERQTAVNYIPGNDQIYELTRIRGGLEIRPSSFLTGYLQFHDDHALGLPLKYVASNMRDAFDFRQAYLEFHMKPVKIFAGRQELKFGGERVIGISDWTNTSRTFDGFDARIGGKNRVDLFSTSVVTVYPTSLDKHGAGLTFHGAYGSIGSWVPHTVIQPFVLVRALPRVRSQQGTFGSELETTVGSEVMGDIFGKIDYDILGALQRGSYSNDSVHAGAGYAKVAYFEKRLPWRPRLGGEYDYATGNTHQNVHRISTYDQLYPSNHNAFGLVDLFGFQNIKQSRINLDLSGSENLTFLIQEEFLNASSVHDSVYSGGGSAVVKPPPAGFSSDDIGKGFDASMKYVFHDYLVINAGVGHLFPGRLLQANGHGSDITLGYLSFTYRFNVNKR